jgi:hypothetical protein
MSDSVAAVTDDPQKQLAWEARHRPRAGIAATASALGLLAFFILQQVLSHDAPAISGLASLQRALRPGPVGDLQTLRVPLFAFLHDKATVQYVIAACGFVGFLGMAWAVGFLAVATRARRPQFQRWAIYLPIVGGVLYALGIVVSYIGHIHLYGQLAAHPPTVAAAENPNNGLTTFSQWVGLIGGILLAVGLALTAHHARTAGLVTRVFGYFGVAAGVLLIVFPLPLVQIAWMGALAALLLGAWRSMPPAWSSGRAEPWPSAAETAAARGSAPGRQPAPAGPAGPSSARRKRKKRS